MKTLKHSALTLTAAAFALSVVFAGPPAAHAQKKAAARAADILTIVNTGDRLSPGYRVTVTPAGSVHGVVRTRSGKVTINRTDQMIGPTRDRLFEDLKDAVPLDRLSANGATTAPQNNRQQGRRGRSAGFTNRTLTPTTTYASRVTGPQVFVIYRGVRSPNLRAAGDSKGKELYQRVKQAIEVVRLPIPDVP